MLKVKFSNPLIVGICNTAIFWCLISSSVLAQSPPPIQMPPSPPHSGVEPPAAKNAPALTESTAASPKAFLTHFETSFYQETGRYAESLEFAHKLEKASPYVQVKIIGKTPQGRDLVVVIVSKDRAFSPEVAAKTGKPVILIQNGIHAGEIGGKDATSMLLRDIVITKKFASWLDHVIILAIPVFNVDGHERFSPFNRINQNGPKEMGFRVTAQRYNLNRDYLKADAPEMRAWLKLWTSWLPDFLMDNHVTDGFDHQYDVTIGMPTEPEAWPSVGKWTREKFLPLLTSAMEKDGHIVGFYSDPVDDNDLSKGLSGAPELPRFSTGYAALQNRPGLLVETHSLKSYRTQVWAHYDIMRHTLDLIAQNPKELKSLTREADKEVAHLADAYHAENKLFLAGTTGEESTPVTFKGVSSRLEKSDLSGENYLIFGDKPFEIQTRLFDKIKPLVETSLPLAYIIPQQWTSAISLLESHGIKTERLAKEVTGEFESYRFANPKWSERPYEGHHTLNFTTVPVRETRTFPAGSILVPMTQRGARVAFNILEPDGPDSAIRWGFFDTIFEQKEYFSDYNMERIAREMLEHDPKLRQEFEERLHHDAKFAASPSERLNFFYHRSPYFEQDKDVYPVARVVRPL